MNVYYLTVYGSEKQAIFLDLDTAKEHGMDFVKQNTNWIKGKRDGNWILISLEPAKFNAQAHICELPVLTNEITCPLKQFALAVLEGDPSALDAVRDVLKL